MGLFSRRRRGSDTQRLLGDGGEGSSTGVRPSAEFDEKFFDEDEDLDEPNRSLLFPHIIVERGGSGDAVDDAKGYAADQAKGAAWGVVRKFLTVTIPGAGMAKAGWDASQLTILAEQLKSACDAKSCRCEDESCRVHAAYIVGKKRTQAARAGGEGLPAIGTLINGFFRAKGAFKRLYGTRGKGRAVAAEGLWKASRDNCPLANAIVEILLKKDSVDSTADQRAMSKAMK